MSLHRRITAAATLAVAAVCLVFGPVGYLYTRAKLFGGVRQELVTLTAPLLHAHQGGPGGGGFPSAPGSQGNPALPAGRSQGGAGPQDDGGQCIANPLNNQHPGGDEVLGS